MTTDTSEKGLETLIVRAHDRRGRTRRRAGRGRGERPPPLRRHRLGSPAAPQDYDREHALDVPQLFAFLRATQPEAFKKLAMVDSDDAKDINRHKFLARLPGRDHASAASSTCCATASSTARMHFDLFYGTPSPGNAKAAERYAAEPLQRHPPARATAATRRSCALDLCLFINGLPVATFELKNSLTKQTVEDAVEQYKRDRDPRELLFEFGRCIVHFAVDDSEVRFCTAPEGQGVVVPAVQPGLERRRRQPAEPGRPQDRLPLEARS